MSISMVDAPCPSNHRRFVVEAGNQDPAGLHQHDSNSLAGCDVHAKRAGANRAARGFLQRGLWVEVYDADTRELLAGPFDPDQAIPAYIV